MASASRVNRIMWVDMGPRTRATAKPNPKAVERAPGGTLGILGAPQTFDAFANIDDLVLSKEVLSFGTLWSTLF